MNEQSDISAALTDAPGGYVEWLNELKARSHIGRDILERQAKQRWVAKVIERLAHGLRAAFPDMKVFPRANLMYMRAFAKVLQDAEIVQQAVGQLPWGHRRLICAGRDLLSLIAFNLPIENAGLRK